MKYTRLFNRHSEYTEYVASANFIRPNVSYCILEDEPHSTPPDFCEEGHIYEIVGTPSYPSTVPASANSFVLSFDYTDTYVTMNCDESVVEGSESITILIPTNPTSSDRTLIGEYMFNGISIPYRVAQQASEVLPYNQQYLTLDILTDGTILWKANSGLTKTISYSKDEGLTWTTITSSESGTPIVATSGDKILIKGENDQYATNKDNYSCFYSSGDAVTYNVYGNIMSLIGGDNFSGLTSFNNKTFVFKSLFDHSTVVSAENLVLPVMTLTNDCYRAMFANTPSLIEAPKLPATTLANDCYWYMFQRTSISVSPELPAATVPSGAYAGMFQECASLSFITCMATDITAASATTSWTQGLPQSGTFVKTSSMTSWTIGDNGIPVGWVVYDSELLAPTITCDGKKIQLSCTTYGADIYYRLDETGEYVQYHNPIHITADTVIQAYSILGQNTSSIVRENCEYVPTHDYADDYLTFKARTNGKIYLHSNGGVVKTIDYSLNGGAWSSITATDDSTYIEVTAGDTVRFRGENQSYATSKSGYTGFGYGERLPSGEASYDSDAAEVDIEGNIMSLIYGDNFEDQITFSGGTYNFCSIFKKLKVVSAENLVLPATTLTNYCYRAMFSWCTYLVVPPQLPATTLAQGCYWYMFERCAITTAPDLLADTLVRECYGYMFTSCASLNYIKCMAENNLSVASGKTNWVNGVAASGTFVKSSDVSVSTWTRGASGIPTNWLVYDDVAVSTPVVAFDGFDTIELTCETPNADIYYRLNQEGNYAIYTSSISISSNTFVEAYAVCDGQTSHTASQTCVYTSDDPFEYSNRALEKWNYNNQEITAPYSVNGLDGHSSSYAKGTFNFETSFALKEAQPAYLWFQHADQSASIYIDGELVEKHWGGYAAFTVDISEYVHSGTNTLKVALKNNEGNYLAPASGDFNFNATLGNVILYTSEVLPGTEYGYDGFHITSSFEYSDANNLVASAATINVKTTIPTGASVVCTISDSGGATVYSATSASTSGEMTFTTKISGANLHLWNGTISPYLYTVKLDISKDNVLYHSFERPYGFRYYEYVINDTSKVGTSEDPYTGFLLNGDKYLLRGCCMHDDIEGKANALSDADYATTFATVQELGLNFLRLAHYPHPKEVYDWCDRLGIVVQTEAPCVNKLQSTMPTDYYTHLETQYTDMVTQHYNHPCILFWGLSNETSTDDKAFGKDKVEGYTALIKNLDSERMVGYVLAQGNGTSPSAYYNDPSNIDWFGCNIYVGWYDSPNSNTPTSQINTRLNNTINRVSKPMAYSEYGCGGTQHCHSDDFMTTTTRGNHERHDIEYMMWLHEGHIATIKQYPQLMFTAQWQLFDVAVASRNEGYTVCLDGVNATTDDNLRRLNNKGLVERDHVTKKDPFYLYKAWWNPTPFVHICGKDYTKTTDRKIKCYTNGSGTFTLYVNGTQVATTTASDYIVEFAAQNFNAGDVISVQGSNVSDTFTFDA